jgi:hypothetical protein
MGDAYAGLNPVNRSAGGLNMAYPDRSNASEIKLMKPSRTVRDLAVADPQKHP